jgi:shikimate kinase
VNRQIKNIALIGFMGTGKSSVGHLVAEDLGFHFVDTDQVIEERLGITITELFARHGEAVFRQFESDVVRELETREHWVISTGGGLAVNPQNLASLKTHSLVICLWATPEIILERISGQNHRPLLQTPDPLARIQELLEKREPFYREADVLIQTGQRPPRDVAQQVVHQFQSAMQAGT